jgi:hypothetical protein
MKEEPAREARHEARQAREPTPALRAGGRDLDTAQLSTCRWWRLGYLVLAGACALSLSGAVMDALLYVL